MTNLKKFLCAVLVLCMSLALCACKADPYCGVYKAKSVEINDMSFDITEAYEKGASLDLMEAAQCTLTLDGKEYEGTWSSEGNKVKVVIEEEESVGVIEEGILSIDLYGTGMTMICTR